MKSSRKKVLWLPKWYPNKYDPLDGIFTVEHAKAAARHSEIYVLFVHSDGEQQEKFREVYRNSEGFQELSIYFRHRKVGFKVVDRILIGGKYLLAQFKGYRKIKRNWGKPDFTHIHTLARSSFLSLWLKWFRRTPFFITEHWSGFDPKTRYKIGWGKRQFIKILLKNATCTTAVSEYLLNLVKKNAPNAEYRVLSNSVDAEVFKPSKESSSSKKKRIIHISTLDNYPKNFGEILHVISEVRNTENNFELHVFGDGIERQKQEQRARDLGIFNSHIFFHGSTQKASLAKEISQSDFLILFSQHETQSCVVIEALLCGIPVIVPKLGGVQELVNDTNGITVTPLSNDDFHDAIVQLLQDKKHFNSQEIRANALQYSDKIIGKKIADLYSLV